MNPERWQQVESIFQQALDIPAEERAGFLERACGGDAELREELESLLRFDNPGGLAMTAAVGGAAVAWAAPAADPVNRRIGPYRVTGVLGHGGMGVVYAASRDDDEFRRTVAIKLVKFGAETPEALARFRHERQILATLAHPNIAQLFDGGTTAEGAPYLVMEYVEGRPLSDYCRERNLGIRERIALFRTVCSAVQYAHQHLIVHRDLKPSNMLVTEAGEVKLLDFGIARLLESGDDAPRTITGAHLLTPDYASPEQVRGEPVTTLTDIYSLGAILYELLADAKPHRLKDYSPAEVARAVCTDEVTRPSAAASEARRSDLRRQLAGDLDNIVLKALHKDKARRYSSVEQLSEDLGRHLAGLPVTAHGDSALYRASKFVTRHAFAVAAAVVIVAAITAAAGIAIYQGRRAERRFAQVRQLANKFLFDFHDKIASLQGATAARGMVVTTGLQYLDSLSAEAGGDEAMRRELAAAYMRVGDVQGSPRGSNLGKFRDALASYEKARSLAAEIYRRDGTNLAAMRLVAVAHGKSGDIQNHVLGEAKAGLASIKSALELERSILERADANEQDHFNYVNHANALGDALIDDDPGAAGKSYHEALRVARVIVTRWNTGDAQANVGSTLQRIGRLAHAQGDPESALASFRESASTFTKLTERFPTNAPYRRELGMVHGWIGNVAGLYGYFNLGDTDMALDYHFRAWRNSEQMYKSDANDRRALFDLSIGAAKLADVHASRRSREGLGYAQRCLELAERFGQSARLYVRARLQCLGAKSRAEAAVGLHAEALKTLDAEEALNKPALAGANPDLAAQEIALTIHNARAASLIPLRQWDRAAAELKLGLAGAEAMTQKLPKDLYFLRDYADMFETQARLHLAQARAGVRAAENAALARESIRRSVELWDRWPMIARSGRFNQNARRRVEALLSEVALVAR